MLRIIVDLSERSVRARFTRVNASLRTDSGKRSTADSEVAEQD